MNTLGENIADNGGAQAAFKALQSSMTGQQLLYPGLQNYTQEQLFFIGMAQVWCSKETIESTVFTVLTNPHAPRELR